MSGTDETKPAAKSGRRNKKGEARRQKSNSPENPAPVEMQTPQREQEQAPQANQQPAVSESLEAVVAEAMVAEPDAVSADAPLPADAPSLAEPATVEPAPVSLQTIANAYRDYTRKSFEEFGSFFEQLSGARSLDKAMEVQTEFMKRAYESSVAESRKIRELHSKLARQTLEPFQGLVGKPPESHGKS
ncbi:MULTISPECIES: phasin family protein [unclassified Bradyrhizobium]|uniref:phasin family protein n=1 Tax=unclassified Bradyrhizobium TaxID=2631580 RepID=UPI001FEF2DB3|nr:MULTISPECIES: phasin family protein [unclassified Bradyrhizobium]